MSKWLKLFLFGIWGVLLIPLMTPTLEKWLQDNVFSDPHGLAATVFPNAGATSVATGVVSANGRVDGRTVTWTPKFGERVDLAAVAEDGGGPGLGWPALVLGLLALGVLGALALALRSRRSG